MTAYPRNTARSTAPAEHARAFDLINDAGVDIDEAATLYVGAGGNVCFDAARDVAGTKTVMTNVPDGTFIPVLVRRVYGVADGTTAGSILLLW